MFHVVKEILISKKRVYSNWLPKIRKSFVYTENNLTDSDGGMFLRVDYLTETNSIIINSNNIKKFNVKPYGFDKMCIDKELIQALSNNRSIQWKKNTSKKFYSLLLNKIHPLHVGNDRTCKILFANDDIIR